MNENFDQERIKEYEYHNICGYLLGLIKRENFFWMAGTDGCKCSHLSLRYVDFDVHCNSSRHSEVNYYGDRFPCDCDLYGIHITPRESGDIDGYFAIGELIREQMNRPDMAIPIVVHREKDYWQYANFTKPPKGERPPVQIRVNEPVDEEDEPGTTLASFEGFSRTASSKELRRGLQIPFVDK